MNQRIAARLVEYRQSAGLSQEKLAEQLNVSRQAVSKWERGESLPDIGNIMALADLYGVTVDELLRGKVARRDAVEADKGAATADADEEGLGNGKAASTDNASETQNPQSENDACAQEPNSSHGEKKASSKRKMGTAREVLIALAAAFGALVFIGVLSAVAFMVDGTVVETNDEAYEVSPNYPMAQLVNEDYYAEGAGSFTASGVVSAIRVDWTDGDLTIREATPQETAGAPRNGTALQWKQEGGLVTIEQVEAPNGDASTPVGSQLDEPSAKPRVEILVPESMAIMDMLQLSVSGGNVEVRELDFMNLKLRQSSGMMAFQGNSIISGKMELVEGELDMQGRFYQTIELVQNNGSSTIACQGEAPTTMHVNLNGGISAIGVSSAEGCQVNYNRTGGELTLSFPSAEAFLDLTQPAGSFTVGEGKTLIDAQISGGMLAVGDYARMK